MKIYRVLFVLVLCPIFLGCDKLNYEIENSKTFKSVQSTYQNIVRMSLDDRINMCRQKKDSTEYPKIHNGWIFGDCMVAGGYIENPAYLKALEVYLLTGAHYEVGQLRLDAGTDIPNSKIGVTYWIAAP